MKHALPVLAFGMLFLLTAILIDMRTGWLFLAGGCIGWLIPWALPSRWPTRWRVTAGGVIIFLWGVWCFLDAIYR